jgi:hypothetical protein
MAETTAGGRPDESQPRRDLLLATKLHVPRSQPGMVARLRLADKLAEGLDAGSRWWLRPPATVSRFCWPNGPGARAGRSPGCRSTRATTTRSGSGATCWRRSTRPARESPWDLVLAYRDRQADIDAWTDFVRRVVTGFGADLAAIQVTGEANLTGIPDAGDGGYPGAVEALVHGLSAAADAKQEHALDVPVGFAVVPEPEPAAGAFWPSVAALGGARLRDWADYVGIDMYPDVFGGRIERADLVPAVDEILRTLRHQALPLAGIGRSTPIRVCENGWPTGPGRPEDEQAAVLDTVLRAVHDRRRELNITHWELFALRDADSTRANPFHQFGIVRDDYSPKPAFERLRRTFAELRSG